VGHANFWGCVAGITGRGEILAAVHPGGRWGDLAFVTLAQMLRELGLETGDGQGGIDLVFNFPVCVVTRSCSAGVNRHSGPGDSVIFA